MSAEAPSPFNKANADLILRTSDNVEFRVVKAIITEASPFFETMLSLPQPPSSEQTGSPTIPVSDTSPVFEKLLRICYPVPDPTLDTLEELREVMTAALKYDMQAAVAYGRKTLLEPRFFKKTPLGVYAIAVHLDFKEEARLAARRTLRSSILYSFSKELDVIPATALDNLLRYRHACLQAAKKWLYTSDEFDNMLAGTLACATYHDLCDSCHLQSSNVEEQSYIDISAFDRSKYRKLLIQQLTEVGPCGSALKGNAHFFGAIPSDLVWPDCAKCKAYAVLALGQMSDGITHDIDACIDKVPFDF